MTRPALSLAFTAALVFCAGASAQTAASQPQAAASSADGSAPVRLPDVNLYAGRTRIYTNEMAATGMQGVAVLRLFVQPDGHVTSASIERSTGTRVLDDAAVLALSTSTVGPGKDGRVAPLVVAVVAFRRDSPEGILTKHCADFNTDVAWYRANHAGEPLQELLDLQTIAVWVDRLTADDKDPTWAARNAAAKGRAAELAVEACAARPADTLPTVYLAAAREAIKAVPAAAAAASK